MSLVRILAMQSLPGNGNFGGWVGLEGERRGEAALGEGHLGQGKQGRCLSQDLGEVLGHRSTAGSPATGSRCARS